MNFQFLTKRGNPFNFFFLGGGANHGAKWNQTMGGRSFVITCGAFEDTLIFTPTTSYMSCVTWYLSHVSCHVSNITFFFLFLFFWSGEAYRWMVCYQRGLPRLFFIFKTIHNKKDLWIVLLGQKVWQCKKGWWVFLL